MEFLHSFIDQTYNCEVQRQFPGVMKTTKGEEETVPALSLEFAALFTLWHMFTFLKCIGARKPRAIQLVRTACFPVISGRHHEVAGICVS